MFCLAGDAGRFCWRATVAFLPTDAGRFCWRVTVAFLPAFDFIDWFPRPLNWYVRAADVRLPPL